MVAYYNEIDPKTAAWLRELIKRGHLPEGDVDERSIEDVSAVELLGYTQCHFFAGIGGWPYALRQAGWPDDLPVWTGSPPCQPFSAAGKRKGTKDKRHLWPVFFDLIRTLQPLVVFGEQVASKDGRAWLDAVQSDMEGAAFYFGAVMFPACGVGAPHQRQRTYFVAHTQDQRQQPLQDILSTVLQRKAVQQTKQEHGPCDMGTTSGGVGDPDREGSHGKSVLLREDEGGRNEGEVSQATGTSQDDDLAHASCLRCKEHVPIGRGEEEKPGEEKGTSGKSLGDSGDVSMADTNCESCQRGSRSLSRTKEKGCGKGEQHGGVSDGHSNGSEDVGDQGGRHDGPHETNGFWSDTDWLLCRDAKWRAVEPRTQPLAHGPPARVVRLRGYGNAIVVPQAKAFIESFIEVMGESVE